MVLQRTAAIVCIASVSIAALCGLVLIWIPGTPYLDKLFFSGLMVFLASGSIFSVSATLRQAAGQG
ncbi:MAG: hypothetical protein ACYTJ0_21065 [Planctomycetota bacterium]|jgi:hypothetical protein